MANTVTKTQTASADADLNELRLQYNNLVAKYEALLAKLDTDFAAQNGAVTGSQLDVDYASTLGQGSANEAKQVDVY